MGEKVRETTDRDLFDRARRLAELTGRMVRPGLVGLAIAAVFAISPAGGSLAAKLIAGGAGPAHGHAQVIAQGVANLDGGNLVWSVTQGQALAQAETTTQANTGFVLTQSGEVLIFDRNGKDGKRLAEGEALYLAKGKKHSTQSNSEAAADFLNIQLMKANGSEDEGLFRSEPFESLRSARDIDLVRDVLEGNDETIIPDSDAPVLVFVTDGEVRVTEAGQDDAVSVKAGNAATFEDEIAVRSVNGGGTFVAAVVGPEVKVPELEPAQTVTPEPSTDPVEEETPFVDSGPVDSDGDGLTDNDEATIYGTETANADSDSDGIGDGDEVIHTDTDPAVMDTDQDGIGDGDEVNIYGTSPVLADTDADGLNDGDEVIHYSTDALAADTDGDGITDGEEMFTHFSDPKTEDSDQDGLTDPQELFEYHTDVTNSDTDWDGMNDTDEIMTYVGLDPHNPDSDGDGLLDGDEMPTYGTSPTMADTDGDGFEDYAEVQAGTDPVDAADHP